MKGLLLKDWYVMKQNYKYYPFIIIGFIILSLMSDGNMFFVFYPCLICSMIPLGLMEYDEKSRWERYSGTMPYTKTQMVSSKYFINLFVQLTLLLVMGAAHAAKALMAGDFVLGDFAVLIRLILLMLTVSTITSSISLPFIFKLGVQKGRAVYYVSLFIVCGVGAMATVATALFADEPNLLMAIFVTVGIGIYILSWYLSVVFYKKREIQ